MNHLQPFAKATDKCILKLPLHSVIKRQAHLLTSLGQNREFKQITTAGAATAAVIEEVWGEYVSAVCQILA